MWPKMKTEALRCASGVVMMGITSGVVWAQSTGSGGTTTVVHPATMRKLGSVDPRFDSYNVEMVEVTGGRFWKPYSAEVDARLTAQASAAPDTKPQVGMDPSLFQYRPPIDLTNPRLRKLAEGLGPAYIRVSGTWQNSTFFQND